MWHDHDIDVVRWLHPAMRHVALESWQWIHQVAAPCNVVRGSLALGWHAIAFAQTSAILEFNIWCPFPHITAFDMSFCTSRWNFIQIGPPSVEKMTISAILDCRDPIMGSLKSPCTTSYRSLIETIALYSLVFDKNRVFLHFGDRRTNRWTSSMREAAVSCRELRLNNSTMIQARVADQYEAECDVAISAIFQWSCTMPNPHFRVTTIFN